MCQRVIGTTPSKINLTAEVSSRRNMQYGPHPRSPEELLAALVKEKARAVIREIDST